MLSLTYDPEQTRELPLCLVGVCAALWDCEGTAVTLFISKPKSLVPLLTAILSIYTYPLCDYAVSD
jgi:hypothetical protein